MLKHIMFSSLLEFGPVIIFLISYEYLRIYESTVLLMVATIISTFVTYRLQKRIPYIALYMAMITLVFGTMTLHFHKVKFIQMRDTLYDITAALTLIIGVMLNISFLRLAFEDVISMTTRSWNKLTYMWIACFIAIAIANEFVRRHFSIDVWFNFKGWMVITTSLFGLLSLYLSYESDKEGKD
jgi:intracellular septation protein